jgi:hypothetical protein
MSLSDVNKARYWCGRAAEMRALAETMKIPDAIAFTNQLADVYEKLADHAAQQQSLKSDEINRSVSPKTPS